MLPTFASKYGFFFSFLKLLYSLSTYIYLWSVTELLFKNPSTCMHSILSHCLNSPDSLHERNGKPLRDPSNGTPWAFCTRSFVMTHSRQPTCDLRGLRSLQQSSLRHSLDRAGLEKKVKKKQNKNKLKRGYYEHFSSVWMLSCAKGSTASGTTSGMFWPTVAHPWTGSLPRSPLPCGTGQFETRNKSHQSD